MDLALRRSTDHGRTWSKMQIIADEGELTINQPCPVIDQQTRTIWLPLCRGSQPGLGNAEVLLMKSTDGGQSWSAVQYDPNQSEPCCDEALIRLPGNRQPSQPVTLPEFQIQFPRPLTDSPVKAI